MICKGSGKRPDDIVVGGRTSCPDCNWRKPVTKAGVIARHAVPASPSGTGLEGLLSF